MFTIVSGFGRCGSSLTMQMLEMAGLNCIGEAPAFEDISSSVCVPHHEGRNFLESLPDGSAIKILDPHQTLGRIDRSCRVIWLERDTWQQAQSIVKFYLNMSGDPALAARANRRQQAKAIEKGLIDDRKKAMAAIHRVTRSVLFIRFEDVIRSPHFVARQLLEFCGLPVEEETVHRMVSCVLTRSPNCRPDLEIELRLTSNIAMQGGL